MRHLTSTRLVLAISLLVWLALSRGPERPLRTSSAVDFVEGSAFEVANSQTVTPRSPSSKPPPRPDKSAATYLSRIEPITGYDDPADGYFEAWLAIRDVERAPLSEEKKTEALTKAYATFLGLREDHGDWKSSLVEKRIALTREQLLSHLE